MEEGIVNIAAALKHTEGAEVPTEALMQQPKQEFEGRERVKLRRHEMAERRMRMAAMFAEGKYLKTIAKHFGVSSSTVEAEIGKLIDEYQEAAKSSIARKIAREEALIYMIQLEAIEAWFESKQGKIVNTYKRAREIKSVGLQFGKGRKGQKLLGPREINERIKSQFDAAFEIPTNGNLESQGEVLEDHENEEKTRRRETSAGDPRFLQIVLDCSDRRAKLFNLYPKDGKEGLTDDDVLTMTPNQRMSALRGFLDKAKMKRAQQIATHEAGRNDAVEAMNRKELAEPVPSIFETQAKRIVEVETNPVPVPVPAIPLQPQSQPKEDLGGLWDATA